MIFLYFLYINYNFGNFSDIFESLAWASAQVHCQCSTNSKIVFSEKLNMTAQLAAINASKLLCFKIIIFFFIFYLMCRFI